jgi:sugar phosphate isomerase/epimerase
MAIRWGYCAPCDQSDRFKAGGWNFIEESIVGLLEGMKPDSEWTGPARAAKSTLPIPSANVLLPGTMKVTGPDANLEALRTYMTTTLGRAKKIGMTTLVFGSGVARKVPDGFDMGKAKKQVIDFVSMAAPIAKENGVTLVAEPLNKGETNIMNSVAEAMEIVKAVNHPNFQCLVDSYHFWVENEPLKNLEAAMPWIKHVHLADKDGRTAPGRSGKSDYKPFFKVLKQGGYNGMIAVEALDTAEIKGKEAAILGFVQDAWDAA